MPIPAQLADRIDAVLPQTQCTRCGHTGCRPYAEAVAAGEADINQCPPGGARGIERLSAINAGRAAQLVHGVERPLHVAFIDESLCIGCTLCIQACPVDAIVGAARLMHTVVADWCNGCDLCVAPCPMDCIAMVPVQPARRPWSDDDAQLSRTRYEARRTRLAVERTEREQALLRKARARLDELSERDVAPDEAARKRAVVQAAIERARLRRQLAVKT
jgi:electron transport complex protein RnfB